MRRKSLVAAIFSMLIPCFGLAAETPLQDAAATAFKEFELSPGWTVADGKLVGVSPEYYSLPETALGDFCNDSWTYHTVHPVGLWRNALVGKPEWTDYTVECVLTIEKPAPLAGFRGGETFFNYQWGREAMGSDAAILLRYHGPDDYYMVRLSTGYGHIELWKTHGGVVQVKPFVFTAGKPIRIAATARGPWITVTVEGQEILKYCDPVEPVLKGRAGIGVRESKVSVSEFKVVKADPSTEAVPSHKSDFRVREWVGKKNIFDGSEPVGWIFWNPTEGLELREMKLAPGLMPMVLPSVGVASYDYQTNGTFQITAEGRTFAFSTIQKGKNDSFECMGNWTLSYEAARGYVWDKKVRFEALKDGVAVPEIDDPFFYQMVAPQTEKLPKGRTQPNYCIIESTNTDLIVFPSSHHIWRDGLADLAKYPIRAGGSVVPTIDGWGVAVQTPADNKSLLHIGFCHWGLDMHIRVESSKPLAKGDVLEGHLIYTLWNRSQIAAALDEGVLPVPVVPNPAELFNNIEPVNRFANLSPGLSGESMRLWTGNYKVDRTTGHNDNLCMRVDSADIKVRLSKPYGDDRPNVWQGSSYWTGPYLAPRYKIGMWVKADSFKGKVALIADGFAQPKPKEPKEYRAELPIDGKCDWTYVSFETDMPRNTYSWVLRIDPIGEGVIWVDDVEISPLAGLN